MSVPTSFWDILSHTTENILSKGYLEKSLSFVTNIRFSFLEILARSLSGVPFGRLLTSSPCDLKSPKSSIRTFSSSRNLGTGIGSRLGHLKIAIDLRISCRSCM